MLLGDGVGAGGGGGVKPHVTQSVVVGGCGAGGSPGGVGGGGLPVGPAVGGAGGGPGSLGSAEITGGMAGRVGGSEANWTGGAAGPSAPAKLTIGPPTPAGAASMIGASPCSGPAP